MLVLVVQANILSYVCSVVVLERSNWFREEWQCGLQATMNDTWSPLAIDMCLYITYPGYPDPKTDTSAPCYIKRNVPVESINHLPRHQGNPVALIVRIRCHCTTKEGKFWRRTECTDQFHTSVKISDLYWKVSLSNLGWDTENPEVIRGLL